MTRRPSKRVREQAAELCAIRATDEASGLPLTVPVSTWPETVQWLAHKAFCAALSVEFPADDMAIVYAEAEAILREGWVPK